MGEGRGNGKGRGFGFVASGISDEFQFEKLAVGVLKLDGALGFDSAIRAGAVAGLGENDAVAGLDIVAESATLSWVLAVIADGVGELVGARVVV